MSRFNLEEYETVESRLEKFWEKHPEGRVHTELVSNDGGTVMFKASVFADKEDDRPISTGYAEETKGATPVNKTSHVENCETSAIGRALANMGFATKGKRPSREEMSKVSNADVDGYRFPLNESQTKKAQKIAEEAGVDWADVLATCKVKNAKTPEKVKEILEGLSK